MSAMTLMTQTPDTPDTGFDPAADPRAFRDALGRFGTGVTIVTCDTPEGPLGMTANSFASLSLDPPLVLWSPARASRRFAAFEAAESFAIHVLSAEQGDVARAFARDGAAWDACDWDHDSGAPRIAGGLARFACQRHAVFDGGDHAIIVGRVLRTESRDGAPFLFYAGAYGGFAADG